MRQPVSIPQHTLYRNMIADANPADGLPDHLKKAALGKIERAVGDIQNYPVGDDPYSTEMLKLGIENLRGFGTKSSFNSLTTKLQAATFGHVTTIDNLQDLPRPRFDSQGHLETNIPLPSDTPHSRLRFPTFSKGEQAVITARWEALNSLRPVQPALPQGVSQVGELSVEGAPRDPKVTVSGKTQSGYWLPNTEVSIDADRRVATIALSAHRIFTLAGGPVGLVAVPPGERAFKLPIDLDLPIVRPGTWTVRLVNAQTGEQLKDASFLYDAISSPPRDPRIS